MRAQWRIFSVILVCGLVSIAFAPQAAAGQQDSDEAPIIDDVPGDRDEAREIFANKFVLSVVTTSTESRDFYQGQYYRPLEGAEFYEAVNRPDLADDYRRRRNTNRALLGSAIGSGLVGLTLMSVSAVAGDSGNWSDFQAMVGLSVGTGLLTVVPLTLGVVALNIDHHPVEPYEARRIADEYNRQLADELGIDEDEILEERLPNEDAAPDGDLRVDLFFGDDQDSAFGLTLSGQF